MSKKFTAHLLFLPIILFLAFIIRIQPLPNLKGKYFLGTDPYQFYRKAQIIVDEGKLPERDMMRWLPEGRDLTQQLHLFPYALASTYEILHAIFPPITLYHVAVFSPIVCFLLALIAVYVIATQVFNPRVAIWSVNLLAIISSGPIL